MAFGVSKMLKVLMLGAPLISGADIVISMFFITT
jgi:hypothetical protein